MNLRERTLQIGTWLSIGSPVIAELAAQCGFDWLLIDLEHGCASESTLLSQLQAIRGTGAAAIVRVGSPHADLIGRVLDWGADGIMVPHVSSAAEAEACVKAMRYPPRGTRGVSRSVRAYDYGLRPFEPFAPIFFAQIETIEAVERAPEIAQVDGVDVLFVGPADLRMDIECRNGSRDFDGCRREVAAVEKPCGILLRDPAEADELRALGYTHLAFASDIGILRAGYQRILQ